MTEGQAKNQIFALQPICHLSKVSSTRKVENRPALIDTDVYRQIIRETTLQLETKSLKSNCSTNVKKNAFSYFYFYWLYTTNAKRPKYLAKKKENFSSLVSFYQFQIFQLVHGSFIISDRVIVQAVVQVHPQL